MARPIYTLGINYYDHDSAIALARDGRIVFAIAEERLSRLKKDTSFPVRSIRAALDWEGIEPSDLSQVCFAWQRPGSSFVHDAGCLIRGRIPRSKRFIVGSTRRLARELNQRGGAVFFERNFGKPARPVTFVDHHYAHALSAYLNSGFSDTAVLVVDGRGAWEATTLWKGTNNDCRLLEAHPHPDSLGFLYAAFTDYLGFRRNSDEWKVMGLAPYGGPGVDISRFVSVDGDTYKVNARPVIGRHYGDVRALEAVFGPRRAAESEITQAHKDIAFAVQAACEEAMTALTRRALGRSGLRRLCLAGGVALNAKANGKLLASGLADDVFVQPASADDGTAIGAALHASRISGGPCAAYELGDIYLGPSFSEKEIEDRLRTYKIPFTRPANVSAEAARMMASGKIIGWFQGRMEFGPRALGNRSILADPRDPEMKDRVNAAVKFREGWRPFAPAVLHERAEEFFVGCTSSPFMIVTFPVREPMRSVIPSVTHVDGSARVQTVRRETNPAYYDLIDEFGKITGVPVVMNTSFNLREEPIVCSPKDAVRTFYSSGLDALFIGPFLVTKG